MSKTSKRRVKAIPSTEPAARDEGPRLIPLRLERAEVPMSHYLQLADVALMGPTRKPPIKRKKSPPGTLESS